MPERNVHSPEHNYAVDDALMWLTHIGNDERKLLILLAMHDSGEPLSNTGILEHMERLAQGDLETERSAINGYVKDNFYKVDAISNTEVATLRSNGSPATLPAYELSDKAKTMGVPLAGALLDWSYRHPGMALKQILGKSQGEGGAQSPLRRFYMLLDLLTAPEDTRGPSAARLAEQFDAGRMEGRHVAAHRLADFGWVQHETISAANKRQFEILDPEYRTGKGKRPFERLKPETQLTFNAFKQAYAIKPTWEVDEFFAFVDKCYPDADPAQVRAAKKAIRHALLPDTTTFRGTIRDVSGKLYDDGGKVELEKEYEDAFLEFVEIVDGFCSGDEGLVRRGNAMARSIVQSPQMFKELFMKAREVSNYANQDREMESRLLRIVENAGGLITHHAIREAYREETGRNVTLVVVRMGLARLASQGSIIETHDDAAKYNQRKVPRYSMNVNR